jgi:hypothetical protein
LLRDRRVAVFDLWTNAPIADKLADRIRAALAGGMSVRKTAAKFEVNPSTVQRIARPFGGAERASAAI